MSGHVIAWWLLLNLPDSASEALQRGSRIMAGRFKATTSGMVLIVNKAIANIVRTCLLKAWATSLRQLIHC